MRDSARTSARNFIEAFFPDCDVALLAGSVVRGEETESSDLDIVIFDEKIMDSYRQSYYEFGWPIEVFVHKKSTYQRFFLENIDRARPSLPQMCAEGIIMKDNGTASIIKNEALQLLKAGPAPWKSTEIDVARYTITDLLEDLTGSSNNIEDLFIVSKLAYLIHEFVLRVHNHWIGEGKWIVRALKEFNPEFAESFSKVFDDYYTDRQKEKVIEFADEVLAPYGGRLFEGFSSNSKGKQAI
ncbi:nucleotidyltransferase domain-containing protein [Fictibacillus aquaticus]|uniref:Nucleotidyltransferase n=1 Tax=Fictibacillus aquaticus TaxID=2021314 RepID=A0A235FCB5_9BACL|nr:nucleotidyltransferase domain-containing protein [Fictibacillus aquaticus]OYD58978.1 nucleotidyltransferase [Fictibacillus aquaticus]